MKSRSKLFLVAALAMLMLAGCECNHEYDLGQVTREATCKEEGVLTFTCAKCGRAMRSRSL